MQAHQWGGGTGSVNVTCWGPKGGSSWACISASAGHHSVGTVQADGSSGTPRVPPMEGTVVCALLLEGAPQHLPSQAAGCLPALGCPGLVSAPDSDAQLLMAAFHYCVFTVGPILIINRRSSAAALAGCLPFLFLLLPVQETCPNPRMGAQKTKVRGGLAWGSYFP